MVNPESFLITPEYVRQALDQIIQVTADEHINPLQYLHLVEARMLTSDYSFFPKPRQFALNDLLIGIIQSQYDHQRELYDLPPIKPGNNLVSAIASIKEVASIATADLVGWTWIYFHYVEVTLHLAQQTFCEIVNLDERTIRRYQKSTIHHLTKHLIRMEQSARDNRHKNILCLRLPHQGTVSNLLEREESLNRLRSSTSKHFHIIGANGIGKTVFTEMFIQELILEKQLDQIVWLESPPNTQSVKSHIKERLLIENTSVTLMEYVSIKQVAIVIDSSENLYKELLDLENLLEEFSNAYIFLTSSVFYPLPNCFQLNLAELSVSGAKTLFRYSNPEYEVHFKDFDFNLVVQSVGGNPLAIKLLAQNWSIFDIQTATLMTLGVLFSRLYESLSASERLAWLILALLRSSSTTLSDLSHIDSSDINIDDFITLRRLHIASNTQLNSSVIGLTVSAYQYIQYQYLSSPELQNRFDAFIKNINWMKKNANNLNLIEAVLTTDWIYADYDYLLETVHHYWETGILVGHYATWHTILNRFSEVLNTKTMDLATGHGICQRYLGQWSQARSKFMTIIQFAGRHGYFSNQAKALLELAILLRYQGNYQDAFEALEHVETLVRSGINTNIELQLLIERIELALENNHIFEAKILLANLPDDVPRKNVLQIEIYAREALSLDDINFVVSLSDRLFIDFSYSTSITARIHILMGRIWSSVSNNDAAIKHLSIAVSILIDQDNDPFALARAQSNLAGVLMTSKRFAESSELLHSAKHIQRQIGDRVGLVVTTHNEHVIDRKIVN